MTGLSAYETMNLKQKDQFIFPAFFVILGILSKSPFLIIVGLVWLYTVYKRTGQNFTFTDIYKKILNQTGNNRKSEWEKNFENSDSDVNNPTSSVDENKQEINLNNDFNNNEKPMQTIDPKHGKKIAGLVIGAVAALIILANSIIVIPAGYTGVYQLFGKVKNKALSSGMHLIIPVANIEKMNIRTQDYTMSIASGEGQKIGDDSIVALTQEGLSVSLDMTVLYHLDEQKAPELYKTIGVGYAEIIIRPEIRTAIREVVSQYDAKGLYSEKRTEAGMKILEQLKEKIEPRGVIIEDVLLRHVELPAKLAESIEFKLQAEQESERYEFVLEKETKEAERKRVEAAGQRDAQQIIAQGLTTNYLNYLYIKELKDREGTIYVPVGNNGIPMFRGI